MSLQILARFTQQMLAFQGGLFQSLVSTLTNLELYTDRGISGIASADTSFSFKCTKDRSVILIVQRVRKMRFQNPGVLAKFDALVKLEVVMEVVQSNACYLCLSSQSESIVSPWSTSSS